MGPGVEVAGAALDSTEDCLSYSAHSSHYRTNCHPAKHVQLLPPCGACCLDDLNLPALVSPLRCSAPSDYHTLTVGLPTPNPIFVSRCSSRYAVAITKIRKGEMPGFRNSSPREFVARCQAAMLTEKKNPVSAHFTAEEGDERRELKPAGRRRLSRAGPR